MDQSAYPVPYTATAKKQIERMQQAGIELTEGDILRHVCESFLEEQAAARGKQVRFLYGSEAELSRLYRLTRVA